MRLAILASASLAAVSSAQGPGTVLISSTSAGLAAGGGSIALSPDGRFVAFGSHSAQIVAGDTNASWDVFVRDRVSGAAEIVSRSSSGSQGHPVPYPLLWEMDVAVACSRDARFVAFTSSAPDLVPGDANGAIDVFVRDRVLGTTVIASDAPGGVPANGHAALQFTSVGLAGVFYLQYPSAISITPDGRYVAFASSASNLVAGDANQRQDAFVRDLQTGLVERVSVHAGGGEGNGDSFAPALSADGRFVAFQSGSTNLVPGDTNQHADVFLRDRLLGGIERVSVSTTGLEGNGPSGWWVFYPGPGCHDCSPTLHALHSTISADGRFVAFSSHATNLDPAATSLGGVYLRDRSAGTTRNVTPFADGFAGTPSLSADGRFLALTSTATNLGPPDVNPGVDAFRLDLALGTVELESVDLLGSAQPGDASAVALAEDGHQLAFVSDADFAGSAPPFPRPEVWARHSPASSFAEDCEGTPATCPCANAGAPGHGCANSIVALGARLVATGVPSVAADTLVLSSAGEPATSSTLFVQSDSSSASASAPPFGDGVLCLTGTLRRLRTRTAEFGRAQLGIAGDPRVSQLGAIPPLGASVRYQAVYRNAAAFCTSSTQNASNSIEVVWVP